MTHYTNGWKDEVYNVRPTMNLKLEGLKALGIPVWSAQRIRTDEVLVIPVNLDTILKLITAKILYRGRGGEWLVSEEFSKNPGVVNDGDYLNITNFEDVYPIPAAYYLANFKTISSFGGG